MIPNRIATWSAIFRLGNHWSKQHSDVMLLTPCPGKPRVIRGGVTISFKKHDGTDLPLELTTMCLSYVPTCLKTCGGRLRLQELRGQAQGKRKQSLVHIDWPPISGFPLLLCSGAPDCSAWNAVKSLVAGPSSDLPPCPSSPSPIRISFLARWRQTRPFCWQTYRRDAWCSLIVLF